MTEAEWMNCVEPHSMLHPLVDVEVSNRKYHLLSIECLRRIWPLIRDDRYRQVVEIYDRYLDGHASNEERLTAEEAIIDVDNSLDVVDGLVGTAIWNFVSYPGNGGALAVALDAAQAVKEAAGVPEDNRLKDYASPLEMAEWLAQSAIIRDVFGPTPFRPIKLHSSWLTPTVLALANGIYSERAFDRMRILADALQDAGCENEDILSHCRHAVEHVRGCWVVDLVLGKK